MYLIVGVDAGIKAAYAALDLNGNLVSAGCEKEVSDEKMVENIRQLGIPSIVACDVKKPPSFVSKIAARFNVRLFSPGKDLTSEEKRAIGANIMDVHMRDAYVAAIKAYRNHANRLRQIDMLEVAQDKDELKHLVLQGNALAKLINLEQQTTKPFRRSVKGSRTKYKNKKR